MTAKQSKRMTLKQLESYLQDLDDFEEPKIELEQYATPPHIAAVMLATIDSYNDIDGKFIADLGCGTGRLSIGSLLYGASMVYGFDIDRKALESALRNICDLFGDDECEDESPIEGAYRSCERFNLIQADLASKVCDKLSETLAEKFDTVIMNPPFGTKQNLGLDVLFLKRAVSLTNNVVYSLHKTSTRAYIQKKCQHWAVTGKPITQIKYNLDNTYKFHRRKQVDIDVDLWRIECRQLIK